MLNIALARRRRRWLDLTQEEVATRIGVAEQTLSLWETGKREPTLENAVAWAKALDLELAELLADPEPQIEVGVGEAGARPDVPVSAGGAGSADGTSGAPATPPQSPARRSA